MGHHIHRGAIVDFQGAAEFFLIPIIASDIVQSTIARESRLLQRSLEYFDAAPPRIAKGYQQHGSR